MEAGGTEVDLGCRLLTNKKHRIATMGDAMRTD